MRQHWDVPGGFVATLHSPKPVGKRNIVDGAFLIAKRHAMNSLERFIADNNLDGNAVLSWLQTAVPDQPVSSICQTPADVCESDAVRAVAVMMEHRRRRKA